MFLHIYSKYLVGGGGGSVYKMKEHHLDYLGDNILTAVVSSHLTDDDGEYISPREALPMFLIKVQQWG